MVRAPRESALPFDPTARRILVVDDEPGLSRLLLRTLERMGYRAADARDPASLYAALRDQPDVVLLDLWLGETSGLGLIAEIHERSPHSEIIVMTGHASIESVVACMRAGASDYLVKPIEDTRLLAEALARACERSRRSGPAAEDALGGIVAASSPMIRVVHTIRHLSANESNVLIEAESGTGKELIARAIHHTSLRASGPFVPVDCGALPESIAESELFGYERGAFTGAVRSVPGLFRSAHGGTLFLDEIGELSPALQAKLLRALQEREVRPLGAASAVAVDVRIIAATNRRLAEEVREGRFRADLFYRLRVVEFTLPPLRERREDIPVLAHHFLSKADRSGRIRGIEREAIEALVAHDWPGNVRELENVIEAGVALARGASLGVRDLRLGLPSTAAAPLRVAPPAGIELSIEAYERACLEEALRRAQGDVRRAAQLLGIGRSTFYRKMLRHDIVPPR